MIFINIYLRKKIKLLAGIILCSVFVSCSNSDGHDNNNQTISEQQTTFDSSDEFSPAHDLRADFKTGYVEVEPAPYSKDGGSDYFTDDRVVVLSPMQT